jgi:hypothetical protein
MLLICSRCVRQRRGRMDISADEQRRAFSVWLRTGRLPLQSASNIEVKFNPWHDPNDGRFTFSNSGRYFGGWLRGGFTGGGGGAFGGGGATSRWGTTDKRAEPKASIPRAYRAIARMDVPRAVPAPIATASKPAMWRSIAARKLRSVVRNGYEYQIDESERTRRVTGTLTMSETQLRSRRAQAQAGGVDRRSRDDGGHYIAARFNGPTEAFNHFAGPKFQSRQIS